MKLINRASDDIQTTNIAGAPGVSFYVRELPRREGKDRNLYRVVFSAKLVSEIGLQHHDRIEFVVDFDRLYFFVNNSEDKGFMLTGYTDKKPNPNYWISSKSLLYQLRETVRNLNLNRYYEVRKSNQEMKGCPLYEVLIKGAKMGRPSIDKQAKIKKCNSF